MESISINMALARRVDAWITTWSARAPTSLGTLPKARSQIEPGMWRGKAWNERAGQAFALVEFGVVDRATANSSLRSATGHKQDDQTAKTKPHGKLLADSGSEPGVNASPLFKEPAARMTQHDRRACSRVGWTIPATHAKTTRFASNTRSGR